MLKDLTKLIKLFIKKEKKYEKRLLLYNNFYYYHFIIQHFFLKLNLKINLLNPK